MCQSSYSQQEKPGLILGVSIYKIKIFPIPEAGECKIKSPIPNLLGFSAHRPLSQLLNFTVVLQRQLQTKLNK